MADNGLPIDSLPTPAPRLPWEFLVLQGVLLIAIAIIPAPHYNQFTCQLMFGLVLSQGVLVAAWFALGPGSLVLRTIGPTLWMLLVAGIGGFVNRPEAAANYDLLLGICVGTTSAITLLLLGSRWMFGWRLGQPQDSGRLPWQYGIKHLLMLTAGFSVLAAGYRFVDVKFVGFLFLVFRFMAPSGGVFAVGVIPAMIVPLLVNDRGWLIGGLVVAVGTSFIASYAAGWQVQEYVYHDDAFPAAAIVVGMTAYFVVALSMVLVRAAGYRLISGKRK